MSIDVLAVLGRGLVDPATPVVTADDAGLTRGDGCFEGLRVHRLPDGSVRVDEVAAHLARMGRSAADLEIAFDPAPWRGLLDQLAAEWDRRALGDEAAVKLVLTRGGPDGRPTAFGTVGPVAPRIAEARRDGVALAVLTRAVTPAFGSAPWLLGGVKTLSYAINMAGQREAARRGADDALFVDAGGALLELPTASVLWSAGGVLRSVAPGASGILGSTTVDLLLRRAAAEGVATELTGGTVDDLRAADVVLVASAVRGPLRVRAIDGVDLPVTGAGTELAARCRRWFDATG